MSQGRLPIQIYYAGLSPMVVIDHAVPVGQTVGEWLDAVKDTQPFINWPFHGIAIFGERVSLETQFSANDRVEWLQPLLIDPKEARRKRAPIRQRKR